MWTKGHGCTLNTSQYTSWDHACFLVFKFRNQLSFDLFFLFQVVSSKTGSTPWNQCPTGNPSFSPKISSKTKSPTRARPRPRSWLPKTWPRTRNIRSPSRPAADITSTTTTAAPRVTVRSRKVRPLRQSSGVRFPHLWCPYLLSLGTGEATRWSLTAPTK